MIPAIEAKNEVEGAEGWVRESEVRQRRVLNNCHDPFSNVFDAIPWPPTESSEPSSADSLSSGQSACYASDRSESDAESCDFDLRSDFSPRNSCECVETSQGLNPTFYGMEMSEDEEPCPLQNPTAMRRITSVVDRDSQLKEVVQAKGKRELLVNPAYGADSPDCPEDSEAGEGECHTVTKIRRLKSVVKAGCLVLPTSTALVGNEYIGHTSLNPTYGDLDSQSDTSEEEATPKSYIPFTDLRLSPFHDAAYRNAGTSLKELSSDRRGAPSQSLPMLLFQDLSHSPTQNMGTLTWRNVAFSGSEGSDAEDTCLEADPAVADLQIQWKEKLRADSMDLPAVALKLPSSLSPSSKHDSSTQTPPFASSFLEDVHLQPSKSERDAVQTQAPSLVKVKGIKTTLVTPVRSIPTDSFEDIDIRISSGSELRRTVPCNKATKPTALNKSSSNLFSTGLKHTRWALRSISLLLDRVEILTPSDKKK